MDETSVASQAVVAQASAPPGPAMPRSAALERTLGRAAQLSKDGATMASLWRALAEGDDDLAAWIRDKASWLGAPAFSGAASAIDAVLDAASKIAADVSDLEVAPIHVFAACVYTAAWPLDHDAWGARLRCYVTQARPAQARIWRQVHDSAQPRHLSKGILAVLESARGYAAGAGVAEIDIASLLGGILNDGSQFPDRDYATTLLVRVLGGCDAVRRHLGDRPRGESARRAFDADVERIFDRARTFQTGRGRRDRAVLRARHVLFALLTDRASDSLGVIEALGRTREGVLAALTSWALDRDESDEDPQLLRQVLAEMREDVFAGYANDLAVGQDQLGILPEVRGLAAVLASREVEPPLSVGLFGDWGSGKSFFMAKLRERIDDLAQACRAKPDVDSAFCGRRGRVVQIEFNAWHYLDANLWSSLAVRVFDRLSEELAADFRAGCLDKLQSMKARAGELAAQRQALEDKRAQLTQDLAKQRAHRTESIRFEEYLHAVARKLAADLDGNAHVRAAATRLGLTASTTVADLRREHAALKTAVGRAVAWWRMTGWPWRLLALLAVTVLPVLAGGLAARFSDALVAVAGGLAALSSAVISVSQRIRRNAAVAIGSLDHAMTTIRDMEAQVRQKESEGERALRASQAEVDARIAELERDQHGLEQRMRDTDAQLAQLSRGDERTFHDFIQDRVASDTYRKNLGVVSAVHRDFAQLVEYLKPSDTPPNVERIILYIDDLDRCPPERVVEVLQAIHILLSLPLFVVVVAVDSRWLLGSLQTYYRRQFPDADPSDDARPQQYLEKIFQIPFALRPMSAEGFSSLVGSLVAAPVVARAGAPVAGRATALGSTPMPVLGEVAPATRALGPARIELSPRGLQLEAAEIQFFRRLAQLGLSPRSTKRFVNLYRIVRASLTTEQLDRFLRGDYQAVQIALALAIGNPAFSAELFAEVLAHRIDSQAALANWCNAREAAGVAALFADLASWAGVESAIRTVARFSFSTGRVLGAAPRPRA